MKFRPLHDRVVVRRIEGEEKTKGGIIIPDTAKEKPQEGEIIAVGPGARDDAGKVNALDVILGRAQTCAEIRGRIPTLIAVDQFQVGCLIQAVKQLNKMIVP